MAAILELERDGTTLDLLAGEDAGWRVQAWHPQVSQATPGRLPLPVVEKMDAIVDASDHDDLAGHFQDMDDMRMGAVRYIGDRTEEHPVWLHCKMDNGTGERRALVRSISVSFLSPVVDSTGMPADSQSKVRLTIEREPYWEQTTGVALPSATPAAAASVIYDYTAAADVVGDAPARIEMMRITSSILVNLWIGTRSANKHGTLANFVNIWECENATTLGTDAALHADSDASPGGGGNTCVEITPGTATWAQRMEILLDDVTANYTDNYGLFLWLLRAMTTTTTTWEIQLKFGYRTGADDSFVEGPIIELDGTSKSNEYDYSEMGVFPIPLLSPQSGLASGTNHRTYAIQIWARRTSGSGTLCLDCLCPIPVDESHIIIGDLKPAGISGFIRMGMTPHNQRAVISLEDLLGGDDRATTLSPLNGMLTLPLGDGRMIIVYSRGDTSILTDAIGINNLGSPTYFPRWHTLRGSE